jgi:iron complex outermembrane receptor protein
MSKRKNNRSLGQQQSRLQQTINGMLLASALIVVPSAMAEGNGDNTTKRHYHISSGSLSHALSQFAGSAGILLSADARLTDGKSSPGLNGEYTVEEGFQKLLAGSGLVHVFTAGNTVTLKVAEKQSQASPVTLPLVMVTGAVELDVNDPYNKSYTVTNSATATKTDTPVMETPTSVQIVPRSVMEDQKASTVTDALENVSGVRAQPALGLLSNIIVRGFTSKNIYRNGLKSNDDFPFQFDTANLQSIEVVKGPAQLYGRTEPGGLVNITTKKPLDIPYYSLEQRFGSYDLYRTEWGATGPLNKDKTLLYRFTGAYQNNNSFRDFVSNDRMLFAPSITWKPTDSTDATLELQVVNQDFIADFGIPVIGKRPAPIPISRSLGDPNTPTSNINQVQLGSLLNHRFNEDWAIHSRFLASFDDVNQTFVTPTPAFNPARALDQDTGIMQRNVSYEENNNEKYATNLDLTGKFNLGFSKHEVLLGFDFYRSFYTYGLKGFYNTPDPALAINIYNPAPSYGIPQSVFDSAFLTSQRPERDRSVFFNQWEGVYFQDQITLWDKLHIMGGGRYDWAETARGRSATYSQASALVDSATRNDDGFSPRVGILYQPVNELSLYGNWTTSFGANNGVSATGGTFAPQIGEQFEAGIKTSLFDDRFLATLAYYYLTKDNLLTPDLSTADLTDSIAIGQQRSQGIELDMTGQITDALSLIGSYAYTDARVTKDDSGFQGKQLSNVPENAGSLWVKYDFSGHKTLNGFSVGLGTVAAGQREGNIDNSFQLPGYVRVDAFAAYKWNIKQARVTAQFNIRNLLDKQYYESTDPDNYVAPALGVAPGAPLMAIGSLRVEF